MRISALARLGALLAAATGAAGIYYESMPIGLAASLGATAFIVRWISWSAPHNHWRDFRRKRPSDP
jgi:hypothetical protein